MRLRFTKATGEVEELTLEGEWAEKLGVVMAVEFNSRGGLFGDFGKVGDRIEVVDDGEG